MALKRTEFAKPSFEEAIAKKQKAQNRAVRRKKEKDRQSTIKPRKTAGRRQISRKKTILANLPPYIKAIPESQAHGSGTYQKRLWRLVSDYVRIRDWYDHKVCVATGTKIEHWTKGQAGHLKPYSTCNGLFKFDLRNIHMQSSSSNKWGNYDTFKDFEKVVRNRGYDFDAFEKENRKAQGCSLRNSDVEKQIRKMLVLMQHLPEKPDYFDRAFSLMKNS